MMLSPELFLYLSNTNAFICTGKNKEKKSYDLKRDKKERSLRRHFKVNITDMPAGIWGSAFTILLQRVLRERKLPSDTVDEMSNTGDLREELRM